MSIQSNTEDASIEWGQLILIALNYLALVIAIGLTVYIGTRVKINTPGFSLIIGLILSILLAALLFALDLHVRLSRFKSISEGLRSTLDSIDTKVGGLTSFGKFANTQGLSRFRQQLHHYHLTKKDHTYLWTYNILNLAGKPESGILTDTAYILLSSPPEKNEPFYLFEATSDGTDVAIFAKQRSNGSDMSVEVFPNVQTCAFPLPGVRIHRSQGTLVSSIAILRTEPIARAKQGPITEPAIAVMLDREWNQHAHSTIQRLPIDSTAGSPIAPPRPAYKQSSGPGRFWSPHLNNGFHNAVVYSEPLCFRVFSDKARLFIRDIDINDLEPTRYGTHPEKELKDKLPWLAGQNVFVSRAYIPGGEVKAKDSLRDWLQENGPNRLSGARTANINEWYEKVVHEVHWSGEDKIQNDNMVILGNLRSNPKMRKFYESCHDLRFRLIDDGVTATNLARQDVEMLKAKCSYDEATNKITEEWNRESIVLVTRHAGFEKGRVITSILANQGRGVEAIVQYFLTSRVERDWQSMIEQLGLSSAWPDDRRDSEFQLLFHVDLENESDYSRCTPLLYHNF